MKIILAVVLAVVGQGCCQVWGGPYYPGPVLPLAVLAESPLGLGHGLARVPLIAIPQQEITLIRNAHISSVSPTEPVVTCKLPHYNLDATPAVRVVLQRPLVMTSDETMVGFPSQVSVAHEGLRISVPVGALIAPVPEPSLVGPHIIRVLYAVPTTSLYFQYPYYSPIPYPFRPTGTEGLPQLEESPNQKPEKPGSKPLVTVLDFPSEVARPASLYYQPPVDDDLSNKAPPEAVAPAGIVQSTQPRPFLTPFINSKESPLLQVLRDQADQDRFKSAPGVESV